MLTIAQERGDARCALDLLRVSAEMAERDNSELFYKSQVRTAHNQIEETKSFQRSNLCLLSKNLSFQQFYPMKGLE